MNAIQEAETRDVTAQAPPPFWLIAIAASAGGVPALQAVLGQLPASLPAAVVVVLHRPKSPASILEQILARVSRLPVSSPMYGDAIRPGCIYIARPDLHPTVQPTRRFGYVDGTRVRGVLSSANPLFESAGQVFRERVIGVVLTGSGFDATDGVQAVKAAGGIVIVQDPATALYSGMPLSAVKTGAADRVLPLDEIAPALVAITAAVPGGGAQPV